MISERYAKMFCKDDISKIENYDKAIADTTQTWVCHHRLGLTLDGEFAHNKEDLIRLDMYYQRPYFELIFITHSEHDRLHNCGKTRGPLSAEHKRKLSVAMKGHTGYWAGKTLSDETKCKMSESHKARAAKRKAQRINIE